MHRGQRRGDPGGRVRVLDRLAQLLELVLLGVEVRLEIGARQQGLDAGVEIVELHELVVEVERDRKPVGHGPRRKAQGPQHGHVGRLDAKFGPVPELNLTEGGDRRHRAVPLRRLWPGGPGRGVVFIHFHAGGGGVHEVGTRSVGVHVEQYELEVCPVVGERLECVLIGNGQGAVAEFDGGGGVQRVLAPQVLEFGEVVDAIAVDVGRIGNLILLHPVALRGQRRHVLGQRGRARFTQLHQDRQFHLRAVHIVPHIEREVVRRRGRDHDGHRRHRHLHGHRVIAASRTRHAALCAGVAAGQKE